MVGFHGMGGIPSTLFNKLRMPFAEADKEKVRVSEGAIYSTEESNIHGRTNHGNCVDLAAPEGTPVYAPFEGFAYVGFQLVPTECPDTRIRGYGAGIYVELLSMTELRAQFLHLRDWNPELHFHDPVIVTEDHLEPFEKTKSGRLIIPQGEMIPAGTLIGHVGHSGLADVGEVETLQNIGKVKSWDEDHLHIWIGFRGPLGHKVASFDPFWRYDGDLEGYNEALRGKAHDMWVRTPGSNAREIIWF